jgi:hypothetical protein
MTIKYAEGYINIGQYDGPGETASGKHYTQFSLSVREPGASKRTYLRMRHWEDNSEPMQIVDGWYGVVKYDEKPYTKQDGTNDYNRSAYRLFEPMESGGKPVENSKRDNGKGSLYDADLPF